MIQPSIFLSHPSPKLFRQNSYDTIASYSFFLSSLNGQFLSFFSTIFKPLSQGTKSSKNEGKKEENKKRSEIIVLMFREENDG